MPRRFVFVPTSSSSSFLLALRAGLAGLALLSNCAYGGEDGAAPRGDTRHRFFYNDDGDRPGYLSRGPFQMQQLRDPVDVLVGTPITTLVYHVGSDTVHYPSKVASSFGWRETPSDRAIDVFQRFYRFNRYLEEHGIDQIAVLRDRAVEMGVEFIPSLRMNDAHFANKVPASEHPFTAKFWMENRDLTITPGSETQPGALLNFAHQKVWNFRMAQIEEIIDRYAENGIELDFTRHSQYFPKGKEQPERMTEMVRWTRRLLDDQARRRGKPLLLVARVGPTLKASMAVGLDVEKWIREDLLDYAVAAPIDGLLFDYDMPLGEFLAAAKGTHCRIVAAPDAEGPRLGLMPAEMYRAAMANFYHMGQQGTYLFNFFGRRYPYSLSDYGLFRDIFSPTTLRGRDKHFMWASWRQYLPGSPARPLTMRTPEDVFSVPMYVGDDLPQARSENILRKVELELRVEDLQAEERLRVTLNGAPVDMAAATVEQVDFKKWRRGPPFYKWEQQLAKGPFVTVRVDLRDPLPVAGVNNFTFALERARPADRQAELRVTGVDLHVFYDILGVSTAWEETAAAK